MEPAGGKVLVDGVDITKIGLQDLRSRFGIIPQEPTLFNGTVRYNLDPLSQHTDQEIWEVNPVSLCPGIYVLENIDVSNFEVVHINRFLGSVSSKRRFRRNKRDSTPWVRLHVKGMNLPP